MIDWRLHKPLTLTLNFYSEILNRNPSTGVPREATATLTNNTKTKDVVWKGPQGWGLNINDLTANGISIYPNPAKDNFTIKGLSTATYRVEIMNLNGSILKSVSANGNQTINIASLANNIYILKITNQDGTSQFAKLIKE
jgi:hypothetical protein